MSMTGLYALAAVPVAAYLVSAGIALRRRWIGNVAMIIGESPQISARHWRSQWHPTWCKLATGLKDAVPIVGRVGDVEANRVLLFLGMVSAAAIMPLALLLYFAPPRETTLIGFAAGVRLRFAGAAGGSLFWRRMVGADVSGLQTAGIGVGALGAMVMCARHCASRGPTRQRCFRRRLRRRSRCSPWRSCSEFQPRMCRRRLRLAAAALVAFYVLRGDVAWDYSRRRCRSERACFRNDRIRADAVGGRVCGDCVVAAAASPRRSEPHVRTRDRGHGRGQFGLCRVVRFRSGRRSAQYHVASGDLRDRHAGGRRCAWAVHVTRSGLGIVAGRAGAVHRVSLRRGVATRAALGDGAS